MNQVTNDPADFPNGMNSLSIQSIYLEPFSKHEGCSERILAHGTGFIFNTRFSPNQTCILKFATASHNFSGKEFFSPFKPLSTTGAEPNFVRVWLPDKHKQSWDHFDIHIRNTNEALYKTVKHRGVDCDIAIFELEIGKEDFSKYFFPSINHATFRKSPLKAPENWARDEISEQLLITGFPQPRDKQKLAVTIPAFIATEPRIDYEVVDKTPSEQWPFFLVSARTWRGQSGSPVYTNASSGLTLTSTSWGGWFS